MKTKDLQETVKAFSSMITKRNRPKLVCVDKGIEFAGAFKKFCAAEGIQFYSIMSETKAAIAERTIRSMKNILYPYMEDFGYKYLQKLPQFIAILNWTKQFDRYETQYSKEFGFYVYSLQ